MMFMKRLESQVLDETKARRLAAPRESKVLNILRRGRKRIEKGWCKSALAKDIDGRSVEWHNPSAVAWCMIGAVGEDINAMDVLAMCIPGLAGDNIPDFNDSPERTKAEILA